jgi:hypothetical protein
MMRTGSSHISVISQVRPESARLARPAEWNQFPADQPEPDEHDQREDADSFE